MEYYEAIRDPRFVFFQKRIDNLMMSHILMEKKQKKLEQEELELSQSKSASKQQAVAEERMSVSISHTRRHSIS